MSRSVQFHIYTFFSPFKRFVSVVVGGEKRTRLTVQTPEPSAPRPPGDVVVPAWSYSPGLNSERDKLTETLTDSRRSGLDMGAPASLYHSFVLVSTNSTLLG